jgi:hypothetical protein
LVPTEHDNAAPTGRQAAAVASHDGVELKAAAVTIDITFDFRTDATGKNQRT